ncbi:MAG: helix-turn-helix domain-containing protein [Desulfovibrio sp.]|nr:helix-turn-helix domain-containing protein [Desulfovibrio sp.]MBI4960184.1 helix-turn-helix domain-containing protein [Desulfovibrio sp.]
MTLEEMGALLRHERERQGISLEKAAIEIKISKKYLIALEEGYTKDLPHPVYAKGFVKNYARLLGLDPEEIGAVLSTYYAVDDDHLRESPRYEVRDSLSSTKERKVSFASSQTPSTFRPSLWLGLPLVLGFAALAWYFFSGPGFSFNMDTVFDLFKSKIETQAPGVPQPAKPAQQGQPVKPEAKSAPVPQTQPSKPEAKVEAKSDPAPEAAQEAAAPMVPRDLLATGSSGTKPAPAPQPASEQDITPEKLAAEAQFAANGRQMVEINANQPASLEVTTEDGQKRSLTLVRGQRLSLRFNDKVVVRFQQAPSVAIKLNGKDFPLEGGKADGKSIQFP